ncbi:periplasmic heavy metal sensor [Actibacterium ureilyticum]|uniref:periplasmic heavy metal sensor n=1 Tax=Actibacterium ureilyticum TaxID=1590614 RepID=UPI000BAAF946|nr:periplasmic heavy metal sensor [Actibacterium ureilyticum]
MDTPKKRDRGRMVLIGVLALSLMGNALTLGAVLKLRAVRTELIGPTAAAPVFPRAERRALRAALSARADDLRPRLRALVDARADVVRAGLARPFDRAAVDTAMDGFRTELDATVVLLQTVIGDSLQAQAGQDVPPGD